MQFANLQWERSLKPVYSSSAHYSIGKLRLVLYLFGLISFNSIVLHAQQVTPSKTVYIGSFQPHESERNSNIEKDIQLTLSKKIQGSGLNPVDSTKSTTSERLTEAKQANARFLLEGFYNKKNSDSNLNLYIQVYDPESGQMIDAYSYPRNTYPIFIRLINSSKFYRGFIIADTHCKLHFIIEEFTTR